MRVEECVKKAVVRLKDGEVEVVRGDHELVMSTSLHAL